LSAALCGHSSTDAVGHLPPFDAEPLAYTIRGGDYAKSSIRAPLAARSRITSGRLSGCREIASASPSNILRSLLSSNRKP
jgi:hypothetical protein